MRTRRGEPDIRAVEERERSFHDAIAASFDAAAVPLGTKDRWNYNFEHSILSACGSLEGARVLELGCGDGELTCQLVDGGAAEVVALDLSPAMVALAQERMARFRPSANVRFVTAVVEETRLEAASFDLVVGKWVLHHLDLERAAEEIHRVLRPGGRGVFVETSAFNPVLALARRYLTGRFGVAKYGTADEHPITKRDCELLARRFERCEVDQPNFVFFHLLNRHIVKWRSERFTRICHALDDAAWRRLPGIRPWSYYLRIVLEKRAS